MQKILIIEDDEKLRCELETFLNKNGFVATSLKKFDNAVEDILKIQADLLLLDINLPYTDGEFICKEIRKTSNVPIIMVTSRDSEMDELLSLNYGADQYVTKLYNIQIIHRQQVISRDEIMDYLWESEELVDDNTLNVNIKRLRMKLEELGLTDKIETRRGQGYLLK